MARRGTPLTISRLAPFMGAATKSLALVAEDLGTEIADHWTANNEELQKVLRTALIPETFVVVDRNRPIAYPPGSTAMRPGMENEGPESFDLRKTPRLHHDGTETGREIYARFVGAGILSSCLGQREGEVILQKGAESFVEMFGESTVVLLWKAVVEWVDGSRSVKYLFLDHGQVKTEWRACSYSFGERWISIFYPEKHRSGPTGFGYYADMNRDGGRTPLSV